MEQITFKVNGESITDLCRTLWADDLEPTKAIKILVEGYQGMSEAAAVEILTGKAKLVGVNENTTLVADNAATSKNGNPLSLIDVMSRLLAERERARFDETARREARIGHIRFTGSPWGGGFLPESVLNKLRNGEIGWDEVRPYFEKRVEVLERSFERLSDIKPNQVVDARLKNHLEQITKFSAKRKPEPDKHLRSENGWIAPNGNFYPCGPAQHEELAEILGQDSKTIEKTHVRVSKNILSDWRSSISWAGRRLTQRQKDTIWDWCEKHGEECPKWVFED